MSLFLSQIWHRYELGQLGTVAMNRRIFKEQTTNSGKIPFYKIGTFGGEPDAFISREIFEKYKTKYPYPKVGDILISASGSIGKTIEYKGKDEYFQDSNIVWLNHDERLINSFLKQFYKIVKWQGIEGSTIKRLYNKNILLTQIILPSIKEQTQIGEFFKKLDNLIQTQQKKLEKAKTLKSAYLAEMFPCDGESKPKLRFKGFSQVWETYQLGEVGCYRRGAFPQPYGYEKWYNGNHSQPFVQVVDVTNQLRLAYKTKQRISKLAQPFSVFVPSGKIVVTLQGSIGRVAITQYDSYIDRTLLVFENFTKKINLIFWAYTIQQIFEIEKKKAPGGTIKTITKEALSSFYVSLPTEKEQTKIGNFFKLLDQKIALEQRKLDKLNNIKQAYLNEMFV